MYELHAWTPTCGWGQPNTSAEPAASIFVTPEHEPTFCPVCGADDCLEFSGEVVFTDPADDLKYDLAIDIFQRSKNLSERSEAWKFRSDQDA